MEQFSIKDLERLSGINAHTIRIWERRYRLIEPSRTDTNRRRYSDTDLRRLINIAILNRNGYKISKIAGQSDSEIEKNVAALLETTSGTETELDSLVIGMLALDERVLNEILMKSIISRGFERTMEEIIFPFMKRIGLMWQTGTINAGYEHFITNIFRTRIISALDSVSPARLQKPMRFLLYLPENELHELAILFYGYIVRQAGHEILYLGQMTPLDSVIDIANQWNPSFIITGSSTALPPDPEAYLRKLTMEIPDTKVFIGGTFAAIPGIERIKNIVPVRSVEELRKNMA